MRTSESAEGEPYDFSAHQGPASVALYEGSIPRSVSDSPQLALRATCLCPLRGLLRIPKSKI